MWAQRPYVARSGGPDVLQTPLLTPVWVNNLQGVT